jgi:hypothetical protein
MILMDDGLRVKITESTKKINPCEQKNHRGRSRLPRTCDTNRIMFHPKPLRRNVKGQYLATD